MCSYCYRNTYNDLVLADGSGVRQQVLNGLVVDFQEIRIHFECPAVLLELFGGGEHLLDSARNHTLM